VVSSPPSEPVTDRGPVPYACPLRSSTRRSRGEALVADLDPGCRVDQETEEVLLARVQPGRPVGALRGRLEVGGVLTETAATCA